MKQRIHFIDFEGTPSSGIIEYGVATLQEMEIAQVHTRLCSPTGSIPIKDTLVHGLREEDTFNHDAFEKDQSVFLQLRKSGPFGAHFAKFENKLITHVWPYPGQVPGLCRY